MGKAKFVPLDDRVLVERAKAKEVTDGGIVLPEGAKERPCEGVVVALGTGKLLDDGSARPFSVMVGEVVMFSSYSGTPIEVSGSEYLVMPESDILGVVTG